MSGKPSNTAIPSCAACGSSLVHATCARQAGPNIWTVELRCADCDAREISYYTEDEVASLAREQHRAALEIEAELSRLEALHMEEWVSHFLHALDLELIGPDDFRAHG